MFSLMALGLFIGMGHALEADHLAALASLTSKGGSLRKTIMQGAVWGLGHTLTLFFFGGMVLFAGSSISNSLASWLEFAVGIMLIVLGADVVRRMVQQRVHFHVHQHGDGVRHFHAHSHSGEKREQHDPELHEHAHARGFPLRALFVGLMHGMAGSAAAVLLTLKTVESPLQGLLFILLFGIGSMVGMALVSLAISVPLRWSAKSMTWMHNGIQLAIGVFTIGLGAMVMVETAPFF